MALPDRNSGSRSDVFPARSTPAGFVVSGRNKMPYQELRDGLTFDDVLLLPQFSDLLPSNCDVSTALSQRIRLQIPLLASPMDTVTESRSAIVIAQLGGLGFIHRNLSIERHAGGGAAGKKVGSGVVGG